MEPEQSDEPDDVPAPLPEPPRPEWHQQRVDPPKRRGLAIAATVIGIGIAVVLGIFGLAGLGIALIFAFGIGHMGPTK